MKTGIIIQARRNSNRLPDKVLKKLPYNSDTTVLEQVIRRAKASLKTDKIIVATSVYKEDSVITEIADKENVNFFQGSENNVLERFFFAAKENKLDTIVRITSDCPCISPKVIDSTIEEYKKTDVDYASNGLEQTFMRGADVEVFSFNALEKAYLNAIEDFEKEHVTTYFYHSHPSLFKLKSIKATSNWHSPDITLTLDTPEDYTLLCVVYDFLYTNDNLFSLESIIKLFNDKPWLKLINKNIPRKEIFSSFEDEAIAALKLLKLNGFNNVCSFLKDNVKTKTDKHT